MLEKPKLFLNLKEFWLAVLLLLLLLFVRLFFLYGEFQEFREKPFYYSDVEVIQAYEKWKENEYHTILKLYSPALDMNFFSRTKIRQEEITSKIRLKLFPNKKMHFLDYLGTPYISSLVREIYDDEESPKRDIFTFIERQHHNDEIRSFYKAIYFATPIEKSLRNRVSTLGVSHLIALSGFHLAILSSLLFFLLRIFYRPLQQRFFPYRFDLFDIGFMVLLLLAWYVWFIGSPPSLVRSYTMMLVGWIVLLLGVELISITFLVIVVLILLVIFPMLLLSLAFWFSVAGVFYIFLLLHYFSTVNRYLMTTLISVVIFILMLPIVHMIFPLVSSLQIFSPILSLIFSLFYPISMLLHLFGVGDIFDTMLIKLFTLEAKEHLFLLPSYYGGLYLLLSFCAIFSRWLFYLLLLVSTLFAIGLFSGFLVS